MKAQESLEWILDLYEDQYASLHRLARMLGAGDEAVDVVRSAFLMLYRRSRRLIDPEERVEFLREQVIHDAHSRGRRPDIPDPDDWRRVGLVKALREQPAPYLEILVVSHALGLFGPELARVMRLSVRASNHRLEGALAALQQAVADDDRMPDQIDAVSQELATALRSSQRLIKVPQPEAIEDELRTRRTSRNLGAVRAQLVVVGSLTALAIGAVGGVALKPSTDAPVAPSAQATAPAPKATASVAIQAQLQDAPVYFVGRSDGRLYREQASLPSTANLARAGAEALFTLVPKDPDYGSLWQGKVLGVRRTGNTLVVDLTRESYQGIDPLMSEQAINQMVYTLTELLGEDDLRVRFLADGAAPPAEFSANTGYSRRGLEPMPGVWITSPTNQSQRTAGTLLVTGTSRPEVGAPVINISNRETDQVVANAIAQTTLTQDDHGWLTWTVTVTITEPGTYEVLGSPQHDADFDAPELSTFDTKLVRITRD